MAESTLTMGYADFRSEIGFLAGYGRTSGNWDASQVLDIASVLAAGLRMFYQPPASITGGIPYDWSFMHINTTTATVASDGDTTLPDDFGGIEGDFTFAITDNAWAPVRVVSELQIRTMQQGNTSGFTGIPRYAAIRPRSSDGTTGQRFEVLWWPIPDRVYTLGYRYRVQQGNITAALPYPLGGMVHSQTILACMLAKTDEMLNDTVGERMKMALQHLASSVMYDKLQGPQYFGYNGDRSDRNTFDVRRVNTIRYNNVEFP